MGGATGRGDRRTDAGGVCPDVRQAVADLPRTDRSASHVGANSNLGAGTITCNYDGFSKHRTLIGEGAFVGTNSSLVAPVKIGKGAYIGSGSVIARDVPDDALAVERSPQTLREGWAKRFRDMKAARRAIAR